MSNELEANATHHSPLITHHSLCLLLVRHGETEWNREGRYQGSVDVPLNAVGHRQAAALATQLRAAPIAAVYSSTLRRAYDTAVPIAQAHGLRVVRDPRLNEIDQGQWEGLRVAEIVQRWMELHERWEREPLAVRLPDGETLEEVRARVLAALEDIALLWAGHTVCVVAHKVSLATIKSYACRIPLADALRVMPPNASIEAVELGSGARGAEGGGLVGPRPFWPAVGDSVVPPGTSRRTRHGLGAGEQGVEALIPFPRHLTPDT